MNIVLARLKLCDSLPASLPFVAQNYIPGEIPSSFGKLSNLKDVSLESNLLEGPIPSDIGSISGLVSLDLGKYQYSKIKKNVKLVCAKNN